ncbi:GntR family transcriptional regulator [Agromyces protaetiae]|uniref:GntR family transcriptional regulator n=1 Tax=Agromyces protaetiae TaxID=2509455 RepID=A0A4P6FC13_9MICO|nr:GntR family transcriptional regulator [Agromyces protaetiae]QAY72463.1 GntR family transcriptional regulator [Agromyces protaetiae]
MSPADPTAVGRVADAVRAEILGGVLAAGTPLREEQTAARFGVSRHTVRAAFRRLVAERLAEEEPYRGVRVAAFDRDRVIALQQLRAALEVEAVRIARERYGPVWPAPVLAPARAALSRLDALAAPSSADTEADDSWLAAELAHAEFHRALVEASASPRIVEAHAALGSELLLFLLHVRPHYSLGELADEHRELLDDVQRRGPDAVREHLLHSLALLVGE